MKKYLMIVCMMLISTATFAQQGSTFVGANVNYGLHKNYKNFGIGAKVQYEFIDNWRAEASGNYFFKKDYCTMWDVNLNVHYLIHATDKLNFYPLAGLTLLGSKISGSDVISDSYNDALAIAAGALGMTVSEYKAYAQQMGINIDQYMNQATSSADTSESKFGFNVGAGIEYSITPTIKINFEAKYQYAKHYDRPVLSAGIAFAL